MKSPLLITALLFFSTIIKAQDITLDELVDLVKIPTNAAAKNLQNKKWEVRSSFKQNENVGFILQYINTVIDTFYVDLSQRNGLNSLTYVTKNAGNFDTIFSTAIKQGYKDLFRKSYGPAEDHALHKDSTVEITFRRNINHSNQEKSYEINISEFKPWLTSFMPPNRKKRWSEPDRYEFMLKCMGKKETTLVRNMITGCSCGGALFEQKYTSKTILALTRVELLKIIEHCFKYLNIDPY